MDRLCIFKAAKTYPTQPALVYQGQTYRFTDLAERCVPIYQKLLAVPPERHIAISASNNLNTVVTLLAAMSAQRTIIALPPKNNPTQNKEILNRLQLNPLVINEQSLQDWLAPSPSESPVSPPTSKRNGVSQPACILLTSGTEGVPKGVVLTERTFIASARSSEQNLGWMKNDRWILSLPLHHIGGLSILTRCLLAGTCILLHERFSTQEIFQSINKQNASLLSAVPTTLQRLVNNKDAYLLTRLRAILLGGAAPSTSLLNHCKASKINTLVTFGMTETCSQVATEQYAPFTKTISQDGLTVLQGCQISIVDTNGNVQAPNQIGQIRIAGKMVMEQYIGQLPCNGCFTSNDIGMLDDSNRLHVLGRADTMIITGGENVHPHDVENQLCALHGIEHAVVFSIDNPEYGQSVAAAIFTQLDNSSKDTILEAIHHHFTSHQKPRHIVFFSPQQLSYLPNNKLDRKTVITMAKSQININGEYSQ